MQEQTAGLAMTAVSVSEGLVRSQIGGVNRRTSQYRTQENFFTKTKSRRLQRVPKLFLVSKLCEAFCKWRLILGDWKAS